MATRIRWRITLDELAYVCRVPAGDLDYWADLGALGPRYAERRDQGRWRHITREAAQRAVLMSRLIKAGVRAQEAAQMSCLHIANDDTPLLVDRDGIKITVYKKDLP